MIEHQWETVSVESTNYDQRCLRVGRLNHDDVTSLRAQFRNRIRRFVDCLQSDLRLGVHEGVFMAAGGRESLRELSRIDTEA